MPALGAVAVQETRIHRQPRRHAALVARELTVTPLNGYAALKPVIPILAKLLAAYDVSASKSLHESMLEWLLGVACRPLARTWVFYDDETIVGVLLVEIQAVNGTSRVFCYGYLLARGYVAGEAGRLTELEVEAWGRRQGAMCIEFETRRDPKAWRPRGYHVKGYVMQKIL